MKNQKMFYPLRILPCFFILFDCLLAREIWFAFKDELKIIFHERPETIIGILRKQIRVGREAIKSGDEAKGTLIQLLADHLLKLQAKKIYEPERLLEITEELIYGMGRSPDTYETDRISFLFRNQKRAKEGICLARKNFNKYLFLVRASGLKVWPDVMGYIAQKLPDL